MAIRQVSGRYVCEFQQRGERVFKRLPPGITKAQAQEYETKLRRQAFDERQLGKRPELTLEEAIGRWLQDNDRKDKRKAASEAKQWAEQVKGKMLRQAPEVAQRAISAWTSASAFHIAAGKTAVTGRGALPKRGHPASSTINRRLAMLKAACRHAYKQGWIGENLSGRITMLRERNKREVYLNISQVKSLVRASPTAQCGAAIMIAAYSGLRASELLALGPMPLRAATLAVPPRQSKTGKPRIVPVAGALRPYLSALPLELDYWQLHKQFLVARKRAGMPHLRFHDLRHTCASWLINAGVDIYTLSKILGHSSIFTTQRYAHLYDVTLKKAMAKLK